MPFLKADLGLSSAAAGVFGTSINIGRVIASTPSVRPVNRYAERRTILGGASAAGVLAIVASLTGPATGVLALLIASGIVQTVAVLAGINAIARWFRSGSKGIAMGVRQTAVPIGGLIAAASLPFLAAELGWRPALAIAGALSITSAIVGTVIYRDYEAPRDGDIMRARLRVAVPLILGDRLIRRAIVVGAVLAGSQYAVVVYIQLFLIEDLGRSVAFAAVALVIAQAMGIAGRVIWGIVSDLIFRGSRREVIAIVMAVAAAASLGMAFVPSGSAALIALPLAAVLGLTTVGAPGLFLAQLTDLAPERFGAATLGVAVAFIQGSIVILPLIFGLIVDASGGYRISWFVLAGVLAVAVPVALSIRLRSSREIQHPG